MTSLRRSPKVMQLGAVLKFDRLKALGAAMDWFCWLDEQCSDGCTLLTPKQVDEVLGIKRMSDALAAVGWARVGSDGLVHVVDFEQHNGESAKSRAQHANRQEKYKNSKRGDAKGDAASVSEASTDASADASPRIIYRDIDTKGVVKATLYSERDARPCAAVVPPPTRGQDGFGAWVARVCAQIPQLCQMRTLPPDVEAAALVMYETGFEPTDEQLVALGAFWAAPGDCLHGLRRPGALRFLFEDLPDVCSRAQEWARIARREARKVAAADRARKRNMEVSEPFIRSQDEADRNMELWREVCEEDEHA